MKQAKLVKTLAKLYAFIEDSGHREKCETQDELGVYCTCGKDKAESTCLKLIEDVNREGVTK